MKKLLLLLLLFTIPCLVMAGEIIRTWKSQSGKVILEAAWDSERDSGGEKVALKTAEGKRYTYPLQKLSSADKTYVQDRRAKASHRGTEVDPDLVEVSDAPKPKQPKQPKLSFPFELPKGERYALLIGIDDYQKPLQPLTCCRKDMKTLASAFITSGVPENNIFLMLDNSEKLEWKPTGANIRKQVEAVVKLMESDDLLFVAFSGHGVEIGDKAYLCPMDANAEDSKSLVSRDAIYQLLDECKASQKVFLVDACRSTLTIRGTRSVGSARSMDDPFGRVQHGFVLLSSCDSRQEAHEHSELGNGVFTYFLAEGLRGKAADDEGYISVMNLFSYASRKTKNYVLRTFNSTQIPVIKLQREASDFAISYIPPIVIPTPNTPEVKPSSPLQTGMSDEQYEAKLRELRTSVHTELAAYETLLKDYSATSAKAQAQKQKIQSFALPYLRILERWRSERQEQQRRMQDEGMHAQSPKLLAVRATLESISTQMTGFTSAKLPSTLDELKKLFGTHTAGERMVKTVNGVEYAFRWCPAGTFMMGSPEGELGGYSSLETQHSVTLSQGFWMLETEVTQKMWESVMGDNPSNFKGENLPVEQVNWDECQEFCRKLSSQGLNVQLPTEAQWEYACRAGTTEALNNGKDLTSEEGTCYNLGEVGWYDKNSDSTTHIVGQKKPNKWGLYDMHGNVWEWCSDYWKGDLGSAAQTDPTGADSGSNRVLRGGSWVNLAGDCRSANRYSYSPEYRYNGLGFRVSLVPDK